MKIVLLRHGRTNLPPWQCIRAAELGNWINAYNSAGIADMPSPAARAVAGQCKMIVTSDLLRSEETGRALGSNTPMISDGLFKEVGLPYGSASFIRMPPSVWAVLFRFLWAFGFKTNGESPFTHFRKRARNAATRLISLAQEHGSVLFVGHGLINRYIARELLSAGWNGPEKTKIHHWGFTEYTRALRFREVCRK